MKSIITIALLLSAIVSYGQIPPSFTGTASYRGIKTVYDTVPSLLQISDTAGYVDYVRGYKGFVVYKNQLVEGPFTGTCLSSVNSRVSVNTCETISSRSLHNMWSG
jgi:hypothetical protein